MTLHTLNTMDSEKLPSLEGDTSAAEDFAVAYGREQHREVFTAGDIAYAYYMGRLAGVTATLGMLTPRTHEAEMLEIIRRAAGLIRVGACMKFELWAKLVADMDHIVARAVLAKDGE